MNHALNSNNNIGRFQNVRMSSLSPNYQYSYVNDSSIFDRFSHIPNSVLSSILLPSKRAPGLSQPQRIKSNIRGVLGEFASPGFLVASAPSINQENYFSQFATETNITNCQKELSANKEAYHVTNHLASQYECVIGEQLSLIKAAYDSYTA